MRHPNLLPPSVTIDTQRIHVMPVKFVRTRVSSSLRTCDELGMCQFPSLDCGRKCQREALDAGEVDVPLPATPAGGNFWFDLATPGDALLDVTRKRTARDTAWMIFWWALGYLLALIGAGYAWAKWGESAVRAFWRVVSGVA